MQSLQKALWGKKTYIMASLLGIFQVLVQTGVITISTHQLDIIDGILGALGLAALRAAVSKIGGQNAPTNNR